MDNADKFSKTNSVSPSHYPLLVELYADPTLSAEEVRGWEANIKQFTGEGAARVVAMGGLRAQGN